MYRSEMAKVRGFSQFQILLVGGGQKERAGMIVRCEGSANANAAEREQSVNIVVRYAMSFFMSFP